MITAVRVVVPAHDEEQLIEGCLIALRVASAHVVVPVQVVVVLDACSDATSSICARHDARTIAVPWRNVGAARETGFADASDTPDLWLTTTDADTRVAPSWVTAQVQLATPPRKQAAQAIKLGLRVQLCTVSSSPKLWNPEPRQRRNVRHVLGFSTCAHWAGPSAARATITVNATAPAEAGLATCRCDAMMGTVARIAVIGTGRIGLPVVSSLARAGHLVHAFDARAELRPAVCAAGARWASSAAGASQSADTLFTILPGSPELRSLMLGEQFGAGLLPQLAPETVWVDLTSAAPDLDEELTRAAAAHHVRRLDAGVGGGVEAAERAALTLYVGGDHGLFERVRPQLLTFADPARIHYVGGHGAGHLTKLLVNLLWFGQAVATGEALLLAQRAGLDLGRLTAVLPVSAAASEYVTSALPRLLDGDYLTSFGLQRCVEELDSIERLAKRERVPFELSGQVARIHREALAALGPVDGELMAVAHLERLAGSLIRDRKTST